MRKIIPFFIGVILFLSCSPEWKLGRQFVKSDVAGKVLILPSNEVYWTNLRMDSADYQESIDYSYLLKDIQDSSFLQAYYNQLIGELTRLKIHVYLDDIEAFQDTSQGILINIAQIVVEESDEEYVEEYRTDNGTYSKIMQLTRMDMNFWFEFSFIDSKDNPIIAFDTEYLTDESDGYFYQKFLTGEVYYEKKIIPLMPDDIYLAAENLGKKHAQMFYDILLNLYIQNNYPAKHQVDFLMHYNAKRSFLEPKYDTIGLFQILK